MNQRTNQLLLLLKELAVSGAHLDVSWSPDTRLIMVHTITDSGNWCFSADLDDKDEMTFLVRVLTEILLEGRPNHV